MNLIRTSWYLCILFLLMLLISSTITVIPSGTVVIGIVMIILLILSISFGAIALLLKHHLKNSPEAKIFKSKFISISFISFAVILTLALLFGVVV